MSWKATIANVIWGKKSESLFSVFLTLYLAYEFIDDDGYLKLYEHPN